MRLRKIKLAGFKSFVDPVTLLVSDNLVGIVGPNGCGKSNIMDAVIWVMGESSAGRLRGDALTDVIFNGSGARQPVGRASVELVFDNSERRLGGQFADYAEISIKRQIGRDADSVYLLNGARCRRKDVQDVFLGTGLGPRSYSIIEQGFISRLIEARPEELRAFLEEAAGISRFRERRRETETSMRHTRENIGRVADARAELEKQLDHLQRQARAAERFKTLSAEARRLKSESLALNWREFSNQEAQESEAVRQHENLVEQETARQRRVEADIEKQREKLVADNEALNRAQGEMYQVNSEISRLEQKIEHARERQEELQEKIRTTQETERELQRQLQGDGKKLEDAAAEISALEPQHEGLEAKSAAARNALEQAEESLQERQDEWDELAQAGADLVRRSEAAKSRIQALTGAASDISRRREALRQEDQRLAVGALQERAAQLSREEQAAQERLRQRKDEAKGVLAALQGRRDEQAKTQPRLGELRTQRQENERDIASLEALQHEDSRDSRETAQRWLDGLGLAEAPRLAEQLEVRDGWEAALELVLGRRLHSIGGADLGAAAAAAAGLESGAVELLPGNDAPLPYEPKPHPRLLDKVSAPFPLEALLGRVYLADDLEQAQEICAGLDETESVATRDGAWLNNHWLSIQRPAADRPGMLAREQELSLLKSRRIEQEREITALETAAKEADRQAGELERQLAAVRERLGEQQEHAAQVKARRAEAAARREQAEERAARIAEELERLQQQEAGNQAEITRLQNEQQQGEQSGQEQELRRKTLEQSREQHRKLRDEAREQWEDRREEAHATALQLQQARTQKDFAEQSAVRVKTQLAAAGKRLQALQEDGGAQDDPTRELRRSLETLLAAKTGAEAAVTQARETVEQRQESIRQQEQGRGESERRAAEKRAELEQARITLSESQVRLKTIAEQLEPAGLTPEALLQELPDDADKDLWQEKIDRAERRIQRIGAVNMAAIDEHRQQAERKAYLDSQHQDLSAALETLESAIRKIDRETRARFEETFDRLNDNLREIFPVLFGGGRAVLEMTSQDLLETGITVMARPPGKKNTNIHLLSGGEKAMTAIALVFSIFKLNPAPFCILDEVDAPLDDVNAERFSEMVTKMSEDVQFIIITHNKITMEITRQLLGVTMREAGVSRLVSVNIEQAVEMAATA